MRNNAEKPQQNTVKNHCEKALGNVTAKPKQNHGKTSKKYAESMQNTTKKWRALTSICKWLSLYINNKHETPKTANHDKLLRLSEVNILCMLTNTLKYSWMK